MASPFHYFRKHQKALMAVAAVACMLIFVVGDALSGRGGGGGPRANATVVSWDGGSLSERQLQSLTEQRYIVSDFLTQLFALGYDPENPEPVQAPDFRIRRDAPREAVQNHVIDTYILAEMAEEAGMTVTDNIINDYIKKIGHGRVGQQQIMQILGQFGRDTSSVENLVFENLRRLLLANYYQTTFLAAGRVAMPHDRWEDWRELNEKVALNAAVLPVENYLDDVGAPSEAEILHLYGQLKDMPSNLMADAGGRAMPSPEAGFTTPRKVKLHYLKGSLVDWREKMREEVTEEAIEEFYENNKQILYLLPEGEQDASSETSSDSDEAEAADDESSPEDPAESPAEDAAEDPAEDVETAAPAADEQPATSADANDAPAEQDSTNDEQPLADAPESVEEISEEEEEEETTQEPETDNPADSAVEEISDDDAEVDSSDEPSREEESDAESSPSDEPASETPEASSADENSADKNSANEDPADEDRYSDQKYRPLEEVREEVVDMLATEQAAEKLREQMEAAYADLRSTYSRYGAAAAMAKDEESEPPEVPKRLGDLEAVAKQYNLIAEKSPLMTQRELATESIVGLARSVEGVGGAGPAVYQLAFTDELGLYEPILTNEDPSREWQGDWYLVLKVEDQESRSPELEEVRDQVVETWKRQQAAQKALIEAKKMAEEFEASEQGFEEFFQSRDIEVVTTDLFSRKEFPNGPGQNEAPLLSAGFGMENVGAAFLEEVFAINDDDAKALLNFNESIAYVVQIRTRERTEEELRTLFLREANGWPGLRETLAVRMNRFDTMLQQQLWDSINRQFDPEWVARRRADQ